jgi:4-alpha-glucanotransferase
MDRPRQQCPKSITERWTAAELGHIRSKKARWHQPIRIIPIMDTEPLRQLAESYGVETVYLDDTNTPHTANPEALAAVLRVLGAPLGKPEEADSALRQRRQQLWRRVVEPVQLAWDGRLAPVTVRLPLREPRGHLGCLLRRESGETSFRSIPLADLPVRERREVEGVHYTVWELTLPEPLPIGYHQLTLDWRGSQWESLILSAPVQAFAPPVEPGQRPRRTWGTFLPLYAVRSKRNWGAGDFTDLKELVSWTRGLGGGLVSTLPLLAAFLDEPCEPSPYSPASRLFWNEFYIDVERVPELASCPEAQRLLAGDTFRSAVGKLRAQDLVDYKAVMALKRQVLTALVRQLFEQASDRLLAFDRFVQSWPRLEDYARFRAVTDRLRCSWWVWPERLRAGYIAPGDYDEEARLYHLYVQWQAHEQLGEAATLARTGGTGLYLDLPLGVNSDSYDVWRDRPCFALGASGGAPPDVFFTGGQNWGFPPLNPENSRSQGYRYLRDCLRHLMQFAGMLRIDHQMGLHRLYWVPDGFRATQGVYVNYPSEELYALFCLESQRRHTVLAGEDLGTVPPAVRPAMARHRIHRLHIGQFSFQPEAVPPFGPAPQGAIASMNTHDMPTFHGFWEGADIDDRVDLKILDQEGREQEQKKRAGLREAVLRYLARIGQGTQEAGAAEVLRACLKWLAGSAAQTVLVNLEDLWLAPQPQNVPGTWKERPNWQHKAAFALEDFDQVHRLRETLRALDAQLRDGKSAQP